MKKLFITAVFLLMTWSVAKAQRVVADSVKIDGQMRLFSMLLPEGLKKDAPLVFVLHGYGHEPETVVKTWMDDAALKNGFAICNPHGLQDPKGKHSWNVGYPFQKGWTIDDVKMLIQLASYVQRKYNLSQENTFLTGMSNGGEMCYLLAYTNQHTFKAFGSIAGLTLTWMYNKLRATVPIPFLEIHGTEDRTSEWYGDLDNKGGWGAYLPVPVAVENLAISNHCSELLKPDTIPGINQKSGHFVVKHRLNNPQTHNDVWLYEVVGAPHCWFTEEMNTGEEVWAFFKRYLK